MNILLCWLLAFYFSSDYQAPCIDWSTAKTYDFYDIPSGKAPGRLSWDDIGKLKSVRLNHAAVFLKGAACKPNEMLTWMEQYLMVVEFKDGKRRKFLVSSYGGFLAELGGQLYYIRDADRQKWQELIQELKEKAYHQQ